MGVFIAIEGGDGSGKATQSEQLRLYAENVLRKKVLKVSFPRYGELSAYYIERYLNGDYGSAESIPPELGSLPYALDRFAAREEINHYLSLPDGVVVSDRYVASNLAHQGAKINDFEKRKEFYERTMKIEYEILGIPHPSKSIVLLVPALLAQQNIDKKAARSYTTLTRDIHEADASHLEKAKRNFEEICRLYPDEFTPIVCTNTDGAMRSIEDIHQEVVSVADLHR